MTDTGQDSNFEVGQKVMLKDHPWKGELGIVVRLQKIHVLNKVRPVVRLEAIPGQECFIMRDDQAEIVE